MTNRSVDPLTPARLWRRGEVCGLAWGDSYGAPARTITDCHYRRARDTLQTKLADRELHGKRSPAQLNRAHGETRTVHGRQ
jgi:hypothetical protein